MENKQCVLVTGASRGIGRAVALKLAGAGYNVAINYVSSEDKALAVKVECEQLGVKAEVYRADVSSYSQCEEMVKQVIADFGTIYGLVNNAGRTKDTLLVRMGEQAFDDIIDANLKSTFNLTKLVGAHMMKQRTGSIVNLSSVVGVNGNAGQCNYAASKAGVIGLSKSAAKELGSRGIRVNVVAPGYIRTDMTDVLSDDIQQSIAAHSSLKRIGEATEVANAVNFLLSSEASFITGQVLQVDGGLA